VCNHRRSALSAARQQGVAGMLSYQG
jgi:hypothetical protein